MESPRLDFLSEICCGNPHALAFCHAFLAWVRLIRQTIEEGKPQGGVEHVTLVCIEMMRTLAFNPFWQEHGAALTPLVIQAAKAYVDAQQWRDRADFRDRATSDVLQGQFQEVLWHVAYLVGGYNHMDRMTQKYRHYEYEAKD